MFASIYVSILSFSCPPTSSPLVGVVVIAPSPLSLASRVVFPTATHHDHSEATPWDNSPPFQAEVVEEELGARFCGERGRVSEHQAIKQEGHEVAHSFGGVWICGDVCGVCVCVCVCEGGGGGGMSSTTWIVTYAQNFTSLI